MRWLVCALVAFAAGCFSSNSTTCGDGSVCAGGGVCDNQHGGCVSPAQLEACAGVADGMSCNGLSGQCDRGVCLAVCGDGVVQNGEECDCGTDPQQVPSGCNGNNGAAGGLCSASCELQVCGNGHLDPDEVCDDGNAIDGDGCDRSCTSNETCNNGVTDAIHGEVCDDGNFTSHDGCSSGCVPEAPGWVSQPLIWQARFFHVAAYHPGALQYVVFGGTTPQGSDGTTWLGSIGNNNSPWHIIGDPVPSPPARQHAAMAYDAVKNRMILFGGENLAGPLGDTWQLAGNPPRWQQIATTAAPTPRAGAAAVFDQTRGHVVLFGGHNDTGVLGDTWEFDVDTATWNAIATTGAPPAREFHAMAWEPNHIVLFGGTNNQALGDTWLFDSATATWSQVMTANPVTPRQWAAMAYDPLRGKTVLFGGLNNDVGVFGDMYEFTTTASTWVQVSPPGTVVPARAGATLSYDPSVQKLVLIGGVDLTSTRAFDDIWVLGDEGVPPHRVVWQQRPSGFTPTVRAVPIAYDKAHEQMIMFGGGQAGDDTWAFGGSPLGWRLFSIASRPASRTGHAFAVDTSRDRIVMFGGYNETQLWEWDGTSPGGLLNGAWIAVQYTCPGSCPGLRLSPSFAYDSKRHVFVMIGGDPNDPYTWELTDDGVTAAFTITTMGPPLPYGERTPLAYDVAADRMVLVVGNETWLYVQGTWIKATPPVSPQARVSASFAYDPLRKHLVLYGGLSGNVPLSDSWELHIDPQSTNPATMVAWVPIGVVGATPPGRSQAGFGWFPPLHGFVTFGGRTLLGFAQDTWLLEYASSTPDDRCTGSDDDGDGKIDAADPDCQ